MISNKLLKRINYVSIWHIQISNDLDDMVFWIIFYLLFFYYLLIT